VLPGRTSSRQIPFEGFVIDLHSVTTVAATPVATAVLLLVGVAVVVVAHLHLLLKHLINGWHPPIGVDFALDLPWQVRVLASRALQTI
jgi:hypothetical protein